MKTQEQKAQAQQPQQQQVTIEQARSMAQSVAASLQTSVSLATNQLIQSLNIALHTIESLESALKDSSIKRVELEERIKLLESAVQKKSSKSK